MNSPPDIEIDTRTLAELLTAVEGYRNQLSIFSDTSLGEIESLKYWIQQKINEGVPKVVIVTKLLP